MLLSVDNPVYNTMIVFSVVIAILYITKPDIFYDNNKDEFRQFGTTDGKTLLPIYVIGILLAIVLYIFFYHITKNNTINTKHSVQNIHPVPHNEINTLPAHINQCYYHSQQQQIQQMQNQMCQIVQQQLNSHMQSVQNNHTNIGINKSSTILPNMHNI